MMHLVDVSRFSVLGRCLVLLMALAVIFILDLNVPLGTAIGALYSLVIVLSLIIHKKYTSLTITGLSVLLTILGYFLSPPAIIENYDAPMLNRIISCIALVLVGCMVVLAKKQFLRIVNKSKELTKLANERSRLLSEKMLEIRAETIKFKGLLNSSPDPIIIFDKSDKIRTANIAALDLLKYSLEDLVGAKMDVLIPKRYRSYRKTFYENLQNFESLGLLERLLVDKNGREIPVELKLSSLFMGGEDYICAGMRDISLRKELDKKVIEKDNLYRYFYNNSLQIHISVDPNTGKVLKFNKTFCEKFGYSVEEGLTLKLYDLYSDKSKEKANQIFERFKKGEVTENVEMEVLTKTGKPLIVLLSVSPLKNINGEIVFSQSTMVDITEFKSNELELIKHQRRFVESQRVSKIGTWEIGIDNQEIYWSEEMFNIFGLNSKNPLDYEAVWKCISSADIARIKEAWDNAVNNNEVYEISYAINVNNEEKFVYAKGQLQESDNGRKVMIGTLMDVTENKRREIELLETERRLTESQRITKVGTWEVDFVSETNFWTDEMYRIFGVDKESFTITPESTMELIHPEDRELVDTTFNRAMQENTAYSLVFRVLNNNEVKYVHGRGEFTYNDKGVPVKVLGTMIDITGQKRIENKILHNETRLKKSQNIAQIGTWEWMVKSNELYWSEAMYDIFGQEKAFVPNFDNYVKLIYPEDLNRVTETIANSIELKKPFSIRHRIMAGSKGVRQLECKGELEIMSDGEIKMSGTAMDITTLVEKEIALFNYSQQLEYKNSELEQFAYVASHDLQEPLQTVTSFAELLSQKYSEKIDDKGKQSFEFMLEATERMKKLIKGLLEYSRIGRELKSVPINVNETIVNIEKDFVSTIKEEKVKITVHPDLPNISGNDTEIRLLFQNLISNAIKFNKGDCEIEIGCSQSEKWNEFYVKDNGIGIDEKHKEKVFVIFQRLHTRDVYDGTGIGLSHCKKIVETHGGLIWFDSTPGKGTTFYFTFPK